MSPIGIAVVGAGYWGPNLVRTARRPRPSACAGCATWTGRPRPPWQYTPVRATASYEEVLADPDVAAVAIATPAATHFDLVRAALDAGKHVLVEKPLTVHAAEAAKLVDAGRPGRPVADVRPHLLLHAGRRRIRRADHRRRDRRPAVHRLGPDQPRAGPARRRCPVGPRPARPVDPGLRAARRRAPGQRRRAHAPTRSAPAGPAWPTCRSGCPTAPWLTCTSTG